MRSSVNAFLAHEKAISGVKNSSDLDCCTVGVDSEGHTRVGKQVFCLEMTVLDPDVSNFKGLCRC